MELIRAWFRQHFSDPQVVVLALLLLGGMALVVLSGRILAPVFASIIIAYLLEGLVGRLVGHGVGRLPAVGLVYLLFLVALVASLFGLIPMLSRQATQLLAEIPNMLSQGQQLLMTLPDRYPAFFTEAQVAEIVERIRDELTSWGQALLSRSLASVVGLITFVVYLILLPLLVFFFLKDKDRILGWFRRYMPKNRDLVKRVWGDVDVQIGNYVRGKVWEILIVWAATSLVFSLLDLRFAILLGFVTGISVLIPYVGAAVVTLPVAAVAWFQFGASWEASAVVIAYLIVQALDGNVLVPILFSEVVNLHPVAIIVAVIFFGGLWGFWGIFFAIPLATLVQAVLAAWPSRDELEEGGDPPPSAQPQAASEDTASEDL